MGKFFIIIGRKSRGERKKEAGMLLICFQLITLNIGGKCEREDKTGHEKYDIRLLLKKTKRNHYCIRAEQVGSGTFRLAMKRPRF